MSEIIQFLSTSVLFHLVSICLTLEETAQNFFKVVVLFCILTSNI